MAIKLKKKEKKITKLRARKEKVKQKITALDVRKKGVKDKALYGRYGYTDKEGKRRPGIDMPLHQRPDSGLITTKGRRIEKPSKAYKKDKKELGKIDTKSLRLYKKKQKLKKKIRKVRDK